MKTRRQTDADAAAMSDEEEEDAQVFTFNGQNYDTYQGMVDAKRKRNRDVLASSGLLEAKAAVDNAERAAATARGLKRSKTPKAEPLPRRKSSRLSGEKAAGKFIDYLYII